MAEGIVWFFKNLGLAIYNLFYAISHPGSWLAWLGGLETPEAKEALMRFSYYGGSVDFFFVILLILLVVFNATAIVIRNRAQKNISW